MFTSVTWNNIFIKGRSSVLDNIEGEFSLRFRSLTLDRTSTTELSIGVDSDGDLMNEFLLKMSDAYRVHITCKYEDDSMDIGGTFVCKNGAVLKDLSYSYLVHRYQEDGIDGIASDVEEYAKEGDTFEQFMSEQGLWSFVTRDDRELIYAIFYQQEL
jgi:hypothetical protein